MAIAFDATSEGDVATATSLTVSHTCTGSDRHLLVGVGTYDAGETPATPTVTYDTVSMDNEQNQLFGASDDERVVAFGLVAPSTGADDIVVTVSPTQDEIILAATSRTGVDQTTPLGTPTGQQTDASSTSSMDITSETGNIVADITAWWKRGLDSVGSGQTLRIENHNGSPINSIAQSDKAGETTTTMLWTWIATNYSGHIGVEINQATAAAEAPTGNLLHVGT